ncbi:hypothetical protein ACE6H2_016475 [Prunus campanulata]
MFYPRKSRIKMSLWCLLYARFDRWVVEMGLAQLFNELCSTLPWNKLMDRMMKELHLQGKSYEDIKEWLKRTPMHPRVIATFKLTHASW